MVQPTRVRHWLDERAWTRLQERVAIALRRCRGDGCSRLVSLSVELGLGIDPAAIVASSRSDGEAWFCLEQPDRDATAIAGVGTVRSFEARGVDRFETLAARWRAEASAALADEVPSLPGAGLIAVGGFAFAPDGSGTPAWSGFASASLHVPEFSLARRGDRTWLTVNLDIAPDDTDQGILDRTRRRLGELRRGTLPLLDPAPVGAYEVSSAMPPAHYEEAVSRAVQRIAAGEFEKVVLAREVDVRAPVAHDAAAIFGLLREAFATSYVYLVGRGDATFVGATPELLVRREGQRASTVALAGSMRRSADPAVDDHLAEQLLRSEKDREENAIVARRIARELRDHSLWVTTAEEPMVIKVANIQHLATPIRAQLSKPVDAVSLAGLLHPTPAVGAEPASALGAIPALEGFDRGWYAGTVGWTDVTGDGEFCVALRGGLLRETEARCYAGCGIVAGSVPASELAETEIKLGVMLPLLSG